MTYLCFVNGVLLGLLIQVLYFFKDISNDVRSTAAISITNTLIICNVIFINGFRRK